jgi:hypothetical protein
VVGGLILIFFVLPEGTIRKLQMQSFLIELLHHSPLEYPGPNLYDLTGQASTWKP